MTTELKVEIDGPGVTLKTVDSRAALHVAASYFDLLERTAQLGKGEIRSQGLELRNGSAVILSRTEFNLHAHRSLQRLEAFFSGFETVPQTLSSAWKNLQGALHDLPVGYFVKAVIGSTEQPLSLVRDDRASPPREIASMRVKVVRAGGQEPKVTFESRHESRPFTLAVSEEQARELGAHLYDEIEIQADLHRDADWTIRGGKLREIHYLSKGNSLESWTKWYRENASTWDQIDDIDGELDRDD